MPIYEYRCGSCGERFERLQKLADPPVDACPACGSPVGRLISPPAIQFKGSGFYITDYVKSGKDGKDAAASAGRDGAATKPAEPTAGPAEKPAPSTTAKTEASSKSSDTPTSK
jgi:putative FmdB family regulatory protein